MNPQIDNEFFSGVVEGFYGPPWSQTERLALFDDLSRWGLNTYLYAPKDDLKHRARWRECYSAAEADAHRRLIARCRELNLRFIYALAPGLDLAYASEADRTRLKARFDQMLALGCRDFALLFDDIPDRLSAEDRERFGSFASAHYDTANDLFHWLRERAPDGCLLFCPTPYCGRMARRHLGGSGYLDRVGRNLAPEIRVLWTGPEIISREIPVEHLRELRERLRRKPVIWDNLHANDYDGRRFFCGPYSGRPPAMRAEVAGILSNPNCEYPLNIVPLRTLADFLRCTGEWNPRVAYLNAMKEWHPQFATASGPVSLEDLVLFGDCHYLPHEEGPGANALYESIRVALSRGPGATGPEAENFRQASVRLRAWCARVTELNHRPLFHALSRRLWELREELDLLDRWLEFQGEPGAMNHRFTSDFHLPGTYRGGLVARLQRLLAQNPDGTFTPVSGPNPGG